MTFGEQDLHTLAGAYALDAVTPGERAAFAAHLAGCEQCRQEISEFREATARLGAAAAVDPHAELKRKTIAAAGRISQQAPVAGGDPGRSPVRRLTLRRSTAQRSTAQRSTARRSAVGLLAGLALAASALVITGAVGIGLAMHDQMGQLHESQRQSHMIAVVLNAPDKVMLTARVSTGGVATAVMSYRAHALVFTAHGLRELPAADGYELWLMGPTGVRPVGMLGSQADGMAGPAVLSGLRAGDMVGLTVEPAGGSRRPTSEPIVMIRA